MEHLVRAEKLERRPQGTSIHLEFLCPRLTVRNFRCALNNQKIAATAAVIAPHSLAGRMLGEVPCEFADSRSLAAFRSGGIRMSCFNFVGSEAAVVMS
jgi:hypothetical protein